MRDSKNQSLRLDYQIKYQLQINEISFCGTLGHNILGKLKSSKVPPWFYTRGLEIILKEPS